MRRCLVLWLILFNLTVNTALAKEIINHFDSHIDIQKNGQITVTETIEVNAENTLIKRGIYRDFPTQYLGAWLTQKVVGFNVISVTRNGQEEPFHTQQMSNGIRVYLGSSDVSLATGIHRYQLTYQTDQQLGYFDHYDEFYWNVTGNGWQFDILKVSTSINLPGNGRQQILNQQAWTGYQAEQNKDFIITNTDELLGFETTKTLKKYQGLTIGIQVTKGVFMEPAFDLSGFLTNNLIWVLALLSSLFYLGFYLTAWYRYGRDPEQGIIMARFYPPKNLSPAAVHYIENTKVDNKTVTACLLSLAVKGHITITQFNKQHQIIKRQRKKLPPLSKGERALKNSLFKSHKTTVTLNNKPNSNLLAAKTKLQGVLHQEYQKKCFIDNRIYMFWGWFISVVCFFMVTLLIYHDSMNASTLLLMVFISSMFLLMTVVFYATVPIFTSLIVLTVLATSYSDIWQFMQTHFVWLLFTLFIIGLNLLFGYLLRSPTTFGRHIKDQIDGLKLYMQSAEVHRLNAMNPPNKTIEHYETLLPYAVALGLENQWAEQFTDAINTSSENPGVDSSSGYQPSWYLNKQNQTTRFSFSAASFSKTLNRTVAASTVVPSASNSASSSTYSSGSYTSSSSSSSGSSSSYSSGSGGSSGGGGGGGGGGGW